MSTTTVTKRFYDAMRQTVQILQRDLIETARGEFVAGTKVKWQVHTSAAPDGYRRGTVLPHRDSLQHSCLIAIEVPGEKKAGVAFIDAYQLEFDI